MKKIAFLFVYLAALLNSTTAFAQQPDFLFEQKYPFEWSYAGTHSLEICNEMGLNLFLIDPNK